MAKPESTGEFGLPISNEHRTTSMDGCGRCAACKRKDGSTCLVTVEANEKLNRSEDPELIVLEEERRREEADLEVNPDRDEE